MVPDMILAELVERLHLLPVRQPDSEAQQPVQDLGAASLLAYRTVEVSKVDGVGLLPVSRPGVSQSGSLVDRVMSNRQVNMTGNLDDLTNST